MKIKMVNPSHPKKESSSVYANDDGGLRNQKKNVVITTQGWVMKFHRKERKRKESTKQQCVLAVIYEKGTVDKGMLNINRRFFEELFAKAHKKHCKRFDSERKRRRTMTRLMDNIFTIKSKPTLFITLSFDGLDLSKIDEDLCEWSYKILDSFTRSLCYRYKQCWFVRKTELKYDNFYHFHLMGHAVKYSRGNLYKLKKELREAWAKFVLKEYRQYTSRKKFGLQELKDMCNVKIFKSKHAGYMVKYDKRFDDKKFIERHKHKQLFSVINKKNIEYFPRLKTEVTEAQFDKIKEYIMQNADAECCNLPNLCERLDSNCNHITYAQNFLFREAIDYVLNNA